MVTRHSRQPGGDPLSDNETRAVHDKIVEVLAGTSSVCVATSPAGAPAELWNAGAFFAELDAFTLTFLLETGGTTLRNLQSNPTAALVIAPGGAFQPFLQARAQATVRDAAGKDDALARLVQKEPQAEPLFKAVPVERVDFTISMWRITDVTCGWFPGKVLTPGDAASLAS
jgi:Pyridoxamine 5'-phosphate oxidase